MAICKFPSKLYPKASEKRLHKHDKSIRYSRRGFFRAAALNFFLLQVLFLGLFSYIFGSLFQQNSHIHNIKILWVDYDGGPIGTAIRNAYKGLQGDAFPTLEERAPVQYPTPEEIKEAVCKTNYWAALYTSPGASSRFEAALSGSSIATAYNHSDVLISIWNEALYPATVDTAISTNLQTLSSTARTAYLTSEGARVLQTLSPDDGASISVFADPWKLLSVNIQATTQGSRLIYNTLVFILILIQEFFYLGTINGLYERFKIYSSLWPYHIIAYRNMISLSYTFVGSLCTTAAIWAFRAGWDVNSNQFALNWAILWLFAHANFLWLDVMTLWLPPPYVPMVMISWVMLNITSILIPFELSPAFYKWAYALPSHETYNVLIDIWSGGCNPQLHIALPILFSLELVGLFLSGLGVYRRCHYGLMEEENKEMDFQKRLESAMVCERKRNAERDRAAGAADVGDMERSKRGEDEQRRENQEEEEEIKARNEQRRASSAYNLGPSFDLAFEG